MSILICYERSDSARRAVAATGGMLKGQPVTLLHVWSPPENILADSFGTPVEANGTSVEELDRLGAQRAEEILAEGCALAAEHGLIAQGAARRNRSNVPDTILEAADELDAKTIVIGTRRATALTPRLLGSVSAAVVENSHRPVLVVPSTNAHPPR